MSIRTMSRVEPADTVNQGKIDRTEPRLLAKKSRHGEIRAHSDDTQRCSKGQENCSTSEAMQHAVLASIDSDPSPRSLRQTRRHAA